MLQRTAIIIAALLFWLVPLTAQDESSPRIVEMIPVAGASGEQITLRTNQPQLVCNLWGTNENTTQVHPLGTTDADGLLNFTVPDIEAGNYAIYCAVTDPPGGGVTVALTNPMSFAVIEDSAVEIIEASLADGLCITPVTDLSSEIVDLDQIQSINVTDIAGLPTAGSAADVAIILVDFFASRTIDFQQTQIEHVSQGDLVTRLVFDLKRAFGGEDIRLITIDLSHNETSVKPTTTQLFDRIETQLELAADDGYQDFVVLLNLAMIPCSGTEGNYQDQLVTITRQMQTLGNDSNQTIKFVAPAGDGNTQELVPAALPGVLSVSAAEYPNNPKADYANESKDGIIEAGGVYSGLLEGYGMRGTAFAAPVHAVRLALEQTIDGADTTVETEEAPVVKAQSPEQFVIDYYEHINQRDYDTTWTWLTDRFKQRRSVDFEVDYVGWWDQVAEVEIGRVDNISEGDTQAVVFADLTYHMKDGSIVPHPTPYFYLVRNGDSWLIDNTATQ